MGVIGGSNYKNHRQSIPKQLVLSSADTFLYFLHSLLNVLPIIDKTQLRLQMGLFKRKNLMLGWGLLGGGGLFEVWSLFEGGSS